MGKVSMLNICIALLAYLIIQIIEIPRAEVCWNSRKFWLSAVDKNFVSIVSLNPSRNPNGLAGTETKTVLKQIIIVR